MLVHLLIRVCTVIWSQIVLHCIITVQTCISKCISNSITFFKLIGNRGTN